MSSRNRVRDHYNRMRAQGFIQLKVWIKPEQAESVKQFAKTGDDKPIPVSTTPSDNKLVKKVNKLKAELEKAKQLGSGNNPFADLDAKTYKQVEAYASRMKQVNKLINK